MHVSQAVREANPFRMGGGDQNSSTITMAASLGRRRAFPYGRPLPVASVRQPIAHRRARIDLKAIAEMAGHRSIRTTAVHVEADSAAAHLTRRSSRRTDGRQSADGKAPRASAAAKVAPVQDPS